MNNNIFIYGAGGHASVVADTAQILGWNIIGFIDDTSNAQTSHCGINVFSKLPSPNAANNAFSVICAIGDCEARLRICQFLTSQNYVFATILHPAAIISSRSNIGQGVYIAAGAVVDPGVTIGNWSIINNNATICHDTLIGEACHAAPGSLVASHCIIDEAVWIGLGANIIERITVGSHSFIGAGAVVVKNIHSNKLAYGAPAKEVKNRSTKQYSAIIIPTLCRSKHLKKCLDSLQKCTHADKTDVFIGLDYPLRESHWPGYREICDYLPTVKGFHSLHVVNRTENLGSRKNTKELMKVAAQTHESYIYMDDDCEVSPNFLDFINKGFEKFKDDDSVIAISGYSYRNNFPCGKSNYYFERSGFNVWGYAMTFAKRKQMIDTLTRWYSVKKILNPFIFIYTAWYSWSSLLFLMMHAIKPTLHSDYVLSNYLLYEHKNMIMPAKTLLRNNGFDGSGEHSCAVFGYAEVEIDTAHTFDFIGNGRDNYWEIDRQLHLSKRAGMPFLRMCRHIYEMTRVHIFKLQPR